MRHAARRFFGTVHNKENRRLDDRLCYGRRGVCVDRWAGIIPMRPGERIGASDE
jgi:hypothetical protein